MQFIEDLKNVTYEYYEILVNYLPRIVLAFLVLFIALAIVAMMILVTEFASNVATASAIIPVIASLAAGLGLGTEAILLAMPAALAASWGFILPAGTGPNAIAWATGRLTIGKLVRAGIVLDLVGVFLLVGLVWGMAALL